MKLIAHRGNINGPNPLEENKPEYIESAIDIGYDVEIDVRCQEHQFYLGHDEPQYYVPMTWLVKMKDKLWIHCKDIKSLEIFSSSPIDFHYFWHQEDDFTLTSKKYIWTYPGNPSTLKSVIVMPELNMNIVDFVDKIDCTCYGVCTDYITYFK